MSAFQWVAVALVTIMSSARITRLVTFDHLPPVEKLRNAYVDWTDKRDWSRGYGLLGYCPYCASFWITTGIVLWGWLADFDTAWWIVNAIFGAAYLAAIVQVHDGDPEDKLGDEN